MRPSRLFSPPGTYFINFSTWQRRRLFVVENYARLFLKTIYGYRREGRFQLHAFVVMPEHVHLLLTPADDVTLEHAVQLIKGGYSHALGSIVGRKKKSGNADSPIIEFVTRRTLRITAITSIKIPSSGNWSRTRASTVTPPLSQDLS